MIREKIVIETDKAISNLKKFRNELDKTGKEGEKSFKNTDKEADKFGGTLNRIKNIGFAKVASGIAVIVTSIGLAFKKGTAQAIEFNRQMARVSTLVDTSQVNMKGLRNEILSLYRQTDVPIEQLTESLYQTISAGVDASKAMYIVAQSAKAATADQSDLATATTGVTRALNAYGKEADQAESVTDTFFTAVAKGQTTFNELAGGIGKVAPSAAELDVSLEETLATVSALTLAGNDTNAAYTQTASILRGIIRPTEQARKITAELGIDFGKTALQAKGLKQFLFDLREQTGGNSESLGKLFEDSEALRGILALTGNQADDFTQILDAMDRKAGSTQQAFEKMRKEVSTLWGTVKNQLNAAFLQLGDEVLPIVEKVLKSISNALQGLQDPDQRLIDSLREIGGNEELVIELQARFNMKQLKEQQKALEEELNQRVVIQTDIQRVQERRAIGGAQGVGFGGSSVAAATVSVLKGDNIDLSTQSIKQLESVLAKLKKQIDEVGASDVQLSNALVENVKIVTERIDLMKQETTLSGLIEEGLDGQKEALEKVSKTSRESGVEAKKLVKVYRVIAPAINNIEKEIESLDGNLSNIFGDDLLNQVATFNNEMTTLRNEFEAGIIDEDTFNKRAQEASEEFNKSLQALYQTLKKMEVITPQLEQKFSVAFKQSKEGAEDLGEEVSRAINPQDIANSVRSVMNLADAFGLVSDQVRIVGNGVIDVLMNINAMNTATSGLGMVVGGLGAAAGVVSIVTGIIGANRQREAEQRAAIQRQIEEMKRLQTQIEQNRYELKKNTQAILTENARIAQQARASQLSTIDGLLNELIGAYDGVNFGLTDERVGEIIQQIERSASEAGISGFNGLFDLFQQNQEAGLPVTAWLSENFGITPSTVGDGSPLVSESLLAGILQEMISNQGGYTDTIGGAISEFQNSMQFGGLDQSEAFSQFINRLLDSNINLDRGMIEQLYRSNPEFNPDGLQRTIRELFNNQQDYIGDLTTQEFEDLLSFLNGLIPDSPDTMDFENLGTSVNDLIKNFSDSIKYGGVSLTSAFKTFAESLGDSDLDISESLREYIATIDPTKDQDEIKRLVEYLYDSRDDFIGNATESEYDSLLAFLNQYSGKVEQELSKQIEDAKSIRDLIKVFSDTVRFGGIEAGDALNGFVNAVSQFGGEIPQNLLDRLANIDLESSPDVFKDIIKDLFDNRESYIGTMSESDYDSLLDFFDKFYQDQWAAFDDIQINTLIKEFNDALDFGGVEVKKAFAKFIDSIEDSGLKIPTELLNELIALDPAKDGDLIRQIVRDLFANQSQYMGTASESDFDSLLRFLVNYSEMDTTGQSSSTEADRNASFNFVRNITQTQAETLVSWVIDIAYNVRKIANRPHIPVYDKIATSLPMFDPRGMFKSESGGGSSSVYIDVDISQLANQPIIDEVTKSIRRELLNRGFR